MVSHYGLDLHFPKAFDCVDHNKLWKILKEMGIPDHLTCLLRNLLQVRKQQLELDVEQQTASKQEKNLKKATGEGVFTRRDLSRPIK